MNTETALLQAILAAPDDDLPRLAYADWLEEQGDAERAEFIQVQTALARLPAGDPARAELEEQEENLLTDNAEAWAEPLRDLVSAWAFRRGFVEYAGVERTWVPDGLERLPELFSLAPVRELSLEEFAQDTARGLLASGILSRLRYLHLFDLDEVEASDLHSLLASPDLANLQTLYIDHEYADDFPQAALGALGSSYHLTQLRELGLAIGDSPGDLKSSVVRAIALSPVLRLEKLYLVNARLDPALARLLVRSRALRGLRHLHLEGCALVPQTWHELVDADAWPDLEVLGLHRTDISSNGRNALVGRYGQRVSFETLQETETFFPTPASFRWS